MYESTALFDNTVPAVRVMRKNFSETTHAVNENLSLLRCACSVCDRKAWRSNKVDDFKRVLESLLTRYGGDLAPKSGALSPRKMRFMPAGFGAFFCLVNRITISTFFLSLLFECCPSLFVCRTPRWVFPFTVCKKTWQAYVLACRGRPAHILLIIIDFNWLRWCATGERCGTSVAVNRNK